MRKNIFSLLIILSLVLLGNTLISYGVSVSPGSVRIDFIPNYVYKGTARLGTGGRTPHLGINTTADGFKIIVDKKELRCDVEPCEVNYEVVMPSSFDTPGVHKGYITASEIFDEPQTSQINVRVHIRMPIYIRVPYPGKYLEFSSFKATNKEAGEKIPFEAVLISRGDEVINSVRGLIFVYDRFDKLIGEVSTNSVSDVQPGEKVNLFGVWDSGDYEKGRYHASIIVYYDGKQANRTTNFKLGGLDVELVNYTREVVIGGIKPFQVVVESIWSETIPNMRAKVSVLDNESEEITSFETLTKKLPAWGSVVLPGYLDTSLLSIDDYNISTVLFFENLTKEYEGVVSVVEEPSEKEGRGPGFLSRVFTIRNTLIALIVLLIIILCFVVYLLVFSKRKNIKRINK
ncbi:MAG TPA: hypothetical protein ENL16_00230 [Candidatus Woesearchaeota archaeon]|nr:hypothetical protein [Candidatus Woesearchaeota archaeon]